MKAAKITVLASRLPLPGGSPFAMDCPKCRRALDVHQPDIGRPERLLGTCEACGGWYFVVHVPEEDEAVVLALPDDVAIRRA